MDLNFGGLRGRGVKKQDLPIERDLYLSLEDLFFGCTKKIKISRRVSTWLVPTWSHQLSPPTLTVTLTLETSGWSLMEFCNLRLGDLGLQNTRIWSLEGTSEAWLFPHVGIPSATFLIGRGSFPSQFSHIPMGSEREELKL